jgi:MtaA/CmuA family methyltransferase
MVEKVEMSGKDLLFSVLRHEETDKVPWVPFAGVHAGKLKGYTAKEVLTDGDKLLESLLEVNKLYRPDGQPVVFDLQVEAEILGCELLWAEDAPPSVSTHPLAKDMSIPDKIPTANDGRLPLILDVMRKLKAEVGEHTALYGLITGPFTLASHLRGTEIFMDTIDKSDYLIELMAYCSKVAQEMARMYIEAGMDVIAVVDPVISQISPRMFKKFMHKPFSDLFAYIRDQGVFSSFFVCGDATKNIDPMCLTLPDCIAVDENIDMVTAKEVTNRHNVVLEGNIPLTTRMLMGTQQDNMKYVVDLMEKVDLHNMIISPGCDMPYDTPVENVIGVAETIRDVERAKQILVNYKAAELDLDAVELPEYANLEKPLMEVFTLDSATCAACGYMLQAAERAYEELSGKVDMVEYKATSVENVARMTKMGIRNLPSICINGELRFSSLIPSNRELIEALQTTSQE